MEKWHGQYFAIVNKLSQLAKAKAEKEHSESHTKKDSESHAKRASEPHSKKASQSHPKEASESEKEVAKERYHTVWLTLFPEEQELLRRWKKVSLPYRGLKLIANARCDRYSKVLTPCLECTQSFQNSRQAAQTFMLKRPWLPTLKKISRSS